MRFLPGPVVILAASSVCFITSCSSMRPVAQTDSSTLLEMARNYQPLDQSGSVVSASSTIEPVDTTTRATRESVEDFDRPILTAFHSRNFTELDKEAEQAAASRDSLQGGYPDDFAFYDALSEPNNPAEPTDDDWKAFLETLKQWGAAKPSSAAAQTALAGAYVGYAITGLRTGDEDIQSEEGWALYSEQLQMAADCLEQAARLHGKSPYWFQVMQELSLGQNWDKAKAHELFTLATAFDPTYYQFYREYAFYLLPKYRGKKGEAETFADETARRVGGPYGDFLYFEMASIICGEKNTRSIAPLSWPRIKSGYAALERLYGTSNRKQNRYASLAYSAGDKTVAREIFAQIGDAWDPSAWRDHKAFLAARAWSMSR